MNRLIDAFNAVGGSRPRKADTQMSPKKPADYWKSPMCFGRFDRLLEFQVF